MTPTRLSAADAAREAVEFAGWAWRRAAAVQTVAAAGVALLFVSLRAPLTPGDASDFAKLGLVLSLASWAPLWAALHRLALGGAAAERVWPGGLQFGRTELRFLALGGAVGLAAMLSLLPLIGFSALIFILFRPFGMIGLGFFGRFQASFLIAAALWLAGLVGLLYAALRLAFAPSATVSRRRLVGAEVWPMTRGRVPTILAAWALAQAPALLSFALLGLVDSIELQNGTASRWPMPDAILAGVVLGGVLAFVHAPLSAGVLARLYRAERAVRARAARPLFSADSSR